MTSGTHRDMQLWSKCRWFACKNLRWGLGPIETSKSSAKVSVCMHKTTGEGWNPYCLFILVLSTLLCVLKTTDEGWNPLRLVILMLIALFCMQNHCRGLGPIENSKSDVKPAVVHAQNNRSSLGPIETCYSCPEGAVLHAQNNRWGLEPM